MADTLWIGTAANKLYLSSAFTSTLKTSETITTPDDSPTGIGWDGTNTPWHGTQADKDYLTSGRYSSTLKTSISRDAQARACESFGATGTDTLGVIASPTHAIVKYSGQFTATQKASVDIVGTGETNVRSVSWDGSNNPWCGVTTDRLFLQSGDMTTTLKSSLAMTAVDNFPDGISYEGANYIWSGREASKLYKQSAFTSTIKTSTSVSGIDTLIEGISHGDVTERTSNAPPQASTPQHSAALILPGFISRHVSRVAHSDGALRHTGEVGQPPEDSMPKRRSRFVPGTRSRHLSRALTSRNFHTGEVGDPPGGNTGQRYSRFVPGTRSRHRSHVHRALSHPPDPGVIVPPMQLVPRTKARHRSKVTPVRSHLIDWGRRALTIRGLYRVFNAAEYRFYRSTVAPPVETDTPFATSSSLPHEPTDTYADGTWWLSVSYFNGVLDSGFLPLGPNGETYLRIDIDTGAVIGSPPQAPFSVSLELRAGGVVRVLAIYDEGGANRAADWSINATYDGSPPGEDPVSPTATEAIASSGLSFLAYDLPAQADATTVKVRVQTRRTDLGPVDVFSEGSTILTATADALGPSAPLSGTPWRGSLPEEG